MVKPTDFAEHLYCAVRNLEAVGFAKIPGVFTPTECDRIRAEAYKTSVSARDNLQVRRDELGNIRPALLFWPQEHSPYLHQISHSERMKTIVRHFLGPDVRQLNNQIYFRESGDGDEFAWHQDICFRTPPHEFADIENGYLQTVIAIDRISDNAAVEYIHGSHKQGDLGLIPRDDTERGLRKFVRGFLRGVKATAEPGDVLLWHVLTVHGSEQNVSGRHRMTYMNGFAKESAVLNKTKFPQYMMGGF